MRYYWLWDVDGVVVMSAICLCSRCKGNGFYRVSTRNMDPCFNVAGGFAVYVDNVRHYEFFCRKCSGAGWIEHKRGKGLVPVRPYQRRRNLLTKWFR